MKFNRTVIVVAAVVLGAIAAVTSYAYLHGAQARAYHDARLVDVYVVQSTIPAGLSGAQAIDDGYVKVAQIPAQFRPSDAVSDLAAIRGGAAVETIPAGQVVVQGLFAAPGSGAGTAAGAIPRGDVAITISVDPVHEVAGLVRPGDEVDVLVELAGGPGGAGTEQFLYQDVHVLAVGTSLATPTGASLASSSNTTTDAPSSQSSLVTVAVPPDAAARLALAQSGGGGVAPGSIYLALVPPGSPPANVPPIGAPNLVPPTNTPS
jgi:pilus assembly protein CpaB